MWARKASAEDGGGDDELEKDDVDRDPVRGRRGTSEGQKRGMWNIRLFFRGYCCGARRQLAGCVR